MTNRHLGILAERLDCKPWAMEPHALRKYTSKIIIDADVSEPEPLQPYAANVSGSQAAKLDVSRASGSVAVVPIRGSIEHHRSWWADTSVDDIGATIGGLVADDKIGAIVLAWDSPGGNVEGVPELADSIRGYRGTKPIYSISDAEQFSAAYWLGSAASKSFVTPSGAVGSIGVWTMHIDSSKQMETAGLDITMISAGKYKVEGHPFEPLGDEARASIQADVDQYYDMFVDSVARNRNRRTNTVREGFGQGRTVMAPQAAESGMVDGVATLSELLGAIVPRKRGMSRAEARLKIEMAS